MFVITYFSWGCHVDNLQCYCNVVTLIMFPFQCIGIVIWMVKAVTANVAIIVNNATALRSIHTCAKPSQGGDGWILISLLRYREHIHTYTVEYQNDLNRSAMSVRAEVGLGRTVLKRTRKIGCWTHFLQNGFYSSSSLLHDCICVNTCNDFCWSQFSARFPPHLPVSAPRMCEHSFIDDCRNRDWTM